MADTLSDIRTVVRSDLNITENSSQFPQATIDRAINRARIKSERLFRWPALQDAKTTTSQSNINYYDAPQNWTPQSIWRVVVDDVTYGEDPDGSPLKFRDYLKYKEDYPDSTDKKWALQWLRFFITPTPTVNTLSICIYGQKNGTALSSDSDTTIFSYSLPECNEAIGLEAAAILKKKGDNLQKGGMLSDEAKQILAVAWDRIKEEAGKADSNLPFFNVPDYFRANNAPQVTGNFTNTQGLNV